jgi:hypothetical protein
MAGRQESEAPERGEGWLVHSPNSWFQVKRSVCSGAVHRASQGSLRLMPGHVLPDTNATELRWEDWERAVEDFQPRQRAGAVELMLHITGTRTLAAAAAYRRRRWLNLSTPSSRAANRAREKELAIRLMLQEAGGMVRWHYLVSRANRLIDDLDDTYGYSAGRKHWVVSARHAKAAMEASAAAEAAAAIAGRAASGRPVPADLDFNSFRYVDADGNRVRYYAEQRGADWVLVREMGGVRTRLDNMEASVGRCVEDALGERTYRYSECVTRTDTMRRWQAMTGGNAQWAEEGQEETDDARREKRWAALPHLHKPRRGPTGRRRRPRSLPTGTAAERADAVGSLCQRAAQVRRAAGAAVQWPPAAQPPRGRGRRMAGGGGSPPPTHGQRADDEVTRGGPPTANRQVRGGTQDYDARRGPTAYPAVGTHRNATQAAPPQGEAETDASSGRQRPAQRRHEPTGRDDGPAQAIANTTPRQRQRGNNNRNNGESEEED